MTDPQPEQTDNTPRPEDGPQDVDQGTQPEPSVDVYDPDGDGIEDTDEPDVSDRRAQ